MLRKRIIFTLIYNDGFFIQSRNFRHQKVGNLQWLEKNYRFSNIAFAIDELIVLNTARGEKNMQGFASMISELVNDVFIPISAGGGIKNLSDAELMFKYGADKIVLNSALYDTPDLATQFAKVYGAQSIVASIDYKTTGSLREVFVHNGTTKVDISLNEYVDRIQNMDIGEIYLNSISKDGTGFGYDFDLIEDLAKQLHKPLIIAGGAGNESHLLAGLQTEGVSAVATANLFNFIGDGLPIARKRLIDQHQNLAIWSSEKHLL